MTAAIIAIVALTLVAAGLVWRAWAGHRRRQREADAAARAYDDARAREAAAVEQARHVEAETVGRIESERKAVLAGDRDAVVDHAMGIVERMESKGGT